MTPQLILASGSSYKIGQMQRLGVPFEAVDADIDERAYHRDDLVELAHVLAEAKAQHLRPRYRDAYILGGDQIIAVDQIHLHKPGSHEGCVAQLKQLRGKAHQLICAIALLRPDGTALHADVIYEMHMRPLSDAQIEAYVAQDKPYDCAGSYKLEGAGIRLFESMRGDDYTAIIGLPLTRVYTLLEQCKLTP